MFLSVFYVHSNHNQTAPLFLAPIMDDRKDQTEVMGLWLLNVAFTQSQYCKQFQGLCLPTMQRTKRERKEREEKKKQNEQAKPRSSKDFTKNIHTSSLHIIQNQKQPKWPSTECGETEREHFSAIFSVLLHPSTQMNSRSTMLNETNQTQNSAYWLYSVSLQQCTH